MRELGVSGCMGGMLRRHNGETTRSGERGGCTNGNGRYVCILAMALGCGLNEQRKRIDGNMNGH